MILCLFILKTPISITSYEQSIPTAYGTIYLSNWPEVVFVIQIYQQCLDRFQRGILVHEK